MKALLLDTETNSANNPQLIEFAAIEILDDLQPNGEINVQRYRPTEAIEVGAMAVHHILEEELMDCPLHTTFQLPSVEYIIGHNVDFDWKVIGQPPVKRICTLALARMTWPALSAHTVGAILYHVHPDKKEAKKLLQAAHSAGGDVRTTLLVLHSLVSIHGVPDLASLYALSEEARIPKVMSFGKYKGYAIADVPGDYISWYMRQAETDPYLIEAFKRSRRR